VLHARGPLARIAAIKASLEATLGRRVQGDDRSHDEREFDLFVDLLTGSDVPSGWHAHVVVPFTTALGGEVALADVPGFGPILPSTARDLVEDAVALTQVAVDQDGTVFAVGDVITPAAAVQDEVPAAPADAAPDDAADQADAAPDDAVPTTAAATEAVREALLAMGDAPADRSRGDNLATSAYRTPTRLVRFLQARDLTCVFPHCTRRVTDVDHRTPWPHGATDARNCQLPTAVPAPPPREAGRVYRRADRRRLPLDHPRRLAVLAKTPGRLNGSPSTPAPQPTQHHP
jgi:hypothetical protein